MCEIIMVHLMKEVYHCCKYRAEQTLAMAKRANNVDQIEQDIYSHIRRLNDGLPERTAN